MRRKRMIDLGDGVEVSLWGIVEFLGVVLVGALATGVLATVL